MKSNIDNSKGKNEATDVRVGSVPKDFPFPVDRAEFFIESLREIYRLQAIDGASNYSRGSVLIQNSQVVTREMIDDRLTKR